MPTGTPPKGSRGSAEAAVALARSSSTKITAFSSERSMAASERSSASTGVIEPARKASTSEQASPCHG